jgi:hypothetical protein
MGFVAYESFCVFSWIFQIKELSLHSLKWIMNYVSNAQTLANSTATVILESPSDYR